MATGVKTRIKMPKTAPVGGIITIKTLISHRMESGHRPGPDGNLVPRSIVNRFVCSFEGSAVVDVNLGTAISTNPYFEFEALVPRSGDFEFTWYDDDGSVYSDTRNIVAV